MYEASNRKLESVPIRSNCLGDDKVCVFHRGRFKRSSTLGAIMETGIVVENGRNLFAGMVILLFRVGPRNVKSTEK